MDCILYTDTVKNVITTFLSGMVIGGAMVALIFSVSWLLYRSGQKSK